ncbi:MAG TPA: Gfo/Idh/MocA family oxidoreductase [Ignavibacteriaceae bacterium]|nr:Gfo/Idh/MocA family oxidoreductase [Ignavibacteriaceae bacterium]
METKLKVGVIGTGHLGKLHIKMFKTNPECELVGLFDSNKEQAEAASKEFEVKVYDNIDALLKDVDAVSIAATTSAHYEIAKVCLQNNKHIFIEKPITATIPQAEKLVELADINNLNIQVGHIERFNPALLTVEKYFDNPMFIQSDRLAQFNPRGTDVAVVLDLMIHDIDIILNLIKSPVKKVDANGVAVVSNSIDIANARIEFENGAVANVTASRISQKKMRKMRIFQKDNYISLDFTSGVSEVYRLIPVEEKADSSFLSYGEIGIGDKKKRVIYEQPEVKDVNALQYELALFVSSVLKKENPVVSGRDGLNALKVAEMVMDKINQQVINI